MKSSLIINSPYDYPSKHWKFFDEEKEPELIHKRRKAGYMIADPRARPHQDRGKFVALKLVNKIREHVDKWRDNGYPGITGITKALLEHWKDDKQREYPFFFCQIEAMETLIWLIEAPDSEKVGITIPDNGGEFRRLCSKLATGTGKTVVMAMLIAWQALNRATYPRDGRFSKNIFIVAPNLTVKERLAVLMPSNSMSYYEEFGVVPLSLREKLRQAKIVIRNWHALQWETEEDIKKKKSVDKRGVKSYKAYTRDVLGDMANAHNLIVINDEAHHAWRVSADTTIKGRTKEEKEEIEEATKWIGGLDRIHKTQGILNCFDFSATPFVPNSRRTDGEDLFGWVVSDFGLNDAIESGIVKTPRVVVRDCMPTIDPKTYKPRFYHIYNDPDVKDDLNRRTSPHEPLPDLIRKAYTFLWADWNETFKKWANKETPPVMITVANRTETAARIKYAFDKKDIGIGIEDSFYTPEGVLHIDSAALNKAEGEDHNQIEIDKASEEQKTKLTRKEQARLLRLQVNTVGQKGKEGEKIHNVISVGMLSEGWDAHTVTHIMGLRAFTSQLLCEQVVGRGLRRASYEINENTGLFDPEYVNVFGVPFSFLPHEQAGEEEEDGSPLSTRIKITIEPVKEKEKFAISWPNVLRIDRTYKPKLKIDWEKVKPLSLTALEAIKEVEMAPTVDNNTDLSQISVIDLKELLRNDREQTRIFKIAQKVYEDMHPNWAAPKFVLITQLIQLAEQFIRSGRIKVTPKLYNEDEERKQLIMIFSIGKIIHHFWHLINFYNTKKMSLVLDPDHSRRSTSEMRPWRTGKPWMNTKKSHINRCVYDSTWEDSEAYELDRNKAVDAWVKNDHLGFSVSYIHKGVPRLYYPDFIIRLKSGIHIVLEVKGQQTEQDDAKHLYMREWVEAVSEDGRFGQWAFEVSRKPADILDILAKYAKPKSKEKLAG